MSYVMLGGDAKKNQLSLAKQQAAQRQQQQQQVSQQPVEQPTPFQPAPPSSSFLDSLMSADNLPFVIGGGALLVGGIAYAIWQSRKKA